MKKEKRVVSRKETPSSQYRPPKMSWSRHRLEKNLDMRHNEREIKFIRMEDAVRTVGQLKGKRTLNSGP